MTGSLEIGESEKLCKIAIRSKRNTKFLKEITESGKIIVKVIKVSGK